MDRRRGTLNDEAIDADDARDPMPFGDWVRRQRRTLDLTQAALAHCVGCSIDTVKKIETGARRPSMQMVERLADCLRVPAEMRPTFLHAGRTGFVSHAPAAFASVDDPRINANKREFISGDSRRRFADKFSMARDAGDSPHVMGVEARTNLPAQLTPFVGRAADVDGLMTRVKQARLFTLTGTGGVGKTRLAIEIAGRLRDAFSDGVTLVELAPIEAPSLVPQTVAAAFKLLEQTDHTHIESLCTFVRDKHALLVLDNCEHVIGVAAELTEAVLRSCPNLHVLATSREPLRISGEAVWRVPSLTAPDSSQPASSEALRDYEAVQLFTQTAALAQPGFALTPENASAVAQICDRLGGIPLALEMAAAHVAALSVEEIAAGLKDPLSLLVGGSRTARLRHQTLRAALDWSYALLNAAERTLLAQLSVFAGGCTSEAVEAICATERCDEPISRVLVSLVHKSLVLADAQGSKMRYRLLEPIRQYAEERLAERNELDVTKARHAAHMAAVAEAARMELRRADAVAWTLRLEADNANLQAAILWSLGARRPEFALRIGQGVFRFWLRRGMWREPLDWLEQALAMDEAIAKPSAHRVSLDIRSRASHAAGVMAHTLSQYERANKHFRERLALAYQLEDNAEVTAANTMLGILLKDQGRFDEALAHFDQSIRFGSEDSLKFPWQSKADTLLRLGRFDEAETLYQQAMALNRRIHDEEGLAHTLRGLGEIAWRRGEADLAERYWRENETICRKLNHQRALLWTREHYGNIARVRGQWHEACEQYAHALERMSSMGDQRGVSEVLAECAHLAVATGHYDLAARWLGMARTSFDALGAKLTPYEEDVIAASRNACAQHLDGQAMQRAANDGAQDWRNGNVTRVIDALQTTF